MELLRRWLLVAGVAMSVLPVLAVPAPKVDPRAFLTTFTSTWDGTVQPYLLSVPPGDARSRPLVVVLHGKGVDHAAWFKLTPIVEEATRNGYIVAAPYARGDQFYRGPGEQDVLDVINEVKLKSPVDADRVYLMGHSMGGWGTWYVALRNPGVFASIAPMSGWAPLDVLPNARHLAPLIVHDAGDNIVSVENSRAADKELRKLGLDHQYREESGYGHASRMIGDNLPRVFKWFDAHPRPKSVTTESVAAYSGTKGGSRWLRIVETDGGLKTGTAEAVITSGVVTITTQHVRKLAVDLASLRAGDAAPIRVVVNGVTVNPDRAMGWLLLTNVQGEWKSEYVRELPTWKPRPLAWKDQYTSEPAPRLAERVATLLRKAAGTDICLMRTDAVRPDGRRHACDSDEDGIRDLFLWPEVRVATFETTRGALLAALRTEKLKGVEVLPEGSLPSTRTVCRVVAPYITAKDFESSVKLEMLPQTMTEILADAMEPCASVCEPAAGMRRLPGGAAVFSRLMPLTDSRERDASATVDTILLHFSSDLTDSPLNPFDPERIIQIYETDGVSAHYLIDRQGNIFQLVDEVRAAYHAGKGTMPVGEPRTNKLNDFSIGIEMASVSSRGDMAMFMKPEKYDDFVKMSPESVGYTDAQYAALRCLIEDIRSRHPAITHDRSHILGHEEYAPTRRTDPGEAFQWQRIGLTPKRPGSSSKSE